MQLSPASTTGSALVNAVGWIRAALLGSVGTAAAVLAVAAIGLLMLSGRVPVRRGATVMIGCFVLFSAATIAEGLVNGVIRSYAEPIIPTVVPQASYTPSVPKPVPYDPYAGASVPVQREQPIIR